MHLNKAGVRQMGLAFRVISMKSVGEVFPLI
jgi:hypothetical protein